MPAKARKHVIREGEIGVYHTWSRCAQQAFLCGYDRASKTDFTYRRDWLEKLILYQAQVFAVDVGTYAVLSNHFHVVVRNRPDIVQTWSDEEVAVRWKLAWPEWTGLRWCREVTDDMVQEVLANPRKLQQARDALASVSWYMARIKEPISKMANAEVGKSGGFWSGRFGARELKDDAAVITCMAYVDTNPIKAGLAPSLEKSRYSAISLRITAHRRREAEASVKEFDKTKHSFHTFTVEQADALLAAARLAPISDTGSTLSDELLAAQERSARLASAVRLSGALVTAPRAVLLDGGSTQVPVDPRDEHVSAGEPAGQTDEMPEPPNVAPPAVSDVLDAIGAEDRPSESFNERPGHEQAADVPPSEQATDRSTLDEAADEPAFDKNDGDSTAGGPGEVRQPGEAGREDQVDRPKVDAQTRGAGHGDSVDGPSKSAAECGDGSSPRAQESRRSARKPRTTVIFRSLFPNGVPERITGVPVVHLSFGEYLNVVQWAANSFWSKQRESPPKTLERYGCDPEKWLHAVEHFEQLFFTAVGSEAEMEAGAARNNQKWLQGVTACRDVFG